MTVDRVVYFVLHGGEELFCNRRGGLVIDSGGEDIGHLLVEAPLGETDLPDLLEELLEVVHSEDLTLFHARTIDDVAAQCEVSEHLGRPLPEVCGTDGVHPVADRDDGVEVVVVDATRDLPRPLGSNHSEIPNSCLPHKLLGVVDVGEMLIDGRRRDIEQLSHELLAEPDGAVLIANLDRPVRLTGEDEELRGRDLHVFILRHPRPPHLGLH